MGARGGIRKPCPVKILAPVRHTAQPEGPNGSAGGLSWGKPVFAGNDVLGTFGQFHGCLPLVRAVAHVLAQDALGFALMAFGGGDCG